jgi:hypothetical protein
VLPVVAFETVVPSVDMLETVEVVPCVSLPVEDGVAVVGAVVSDTDVEALVDSEVVVEDVTEGVALVVVTCFVVLEPLVVVATVVRLVACEVPVVVSAAVVLPDDVLEAVEVFPCVVVSVEEGVVVVGTVVPDDDAEELVDSEVVIEDVTEGVVLVAVTFFVVLEPLVVPVVPDVVSVVLLVVVPGVGSEIVVLPDDVLERVEVVP